MELNRTFANNLRVYRAKSGMTQKQLAESAGVSYATICRLEAMYDRLNISTIEKISNALGVPPHLLFFDPTNVTT